MIKKTAVALCVLTILFACKDKSKETQVISNVDKQSEVESNKIRIVTQNYAVVWKWSTDDKQLVEENLVLIAEEMNNLWKKGIAMDAYYNSNAVIDKFEYFPNVFFFLKAESERSAENILNNLTLVKKGIASYKIHPVGYKWLKRNHHKIQEKGLTNSYAAVWTSDNWGQTTDSLTKTQADAILTLWNQGSIENVYFDIEGTQKANDKIDFVFFINANTEQDAIDLCNSLPFVKESIASYQVHPVGVFWLGDYEEFNANQDAE